MKRTIVAIVALAIVVVATPWAIGWRTEQLVRARVAQVDVDKTAKIRLRIDRYERGWRAANAQISVIDREGAPLVILLAAIRHWPFASGGPADWVAVPELGPTVLDALGPWGAKLPELATRTQLSWGGDVLMRIESPAFKRRVPEVTGGTLEIAAIAGTVDWRRDGALTYDFALPVFRVERQSIGGAGVPDVIEFKEAILKGDGSLGTVERRWNQKGSLTAASVLATEAGTTVLTAATPVVTYADRDEGEYAGVQFTFAVASVSAKHALQNLSDAAIDFGFDARHLAKEPLGRILDARANAAARQSAAPAPGPPGRAAVSEPQFEAMINDVLSGSPAADIRFMLKAREGRIEIKLALAFDGLNFKPKSNTDSWLQRLDAELNARASTSLVVSGTRAGADAAASMLGAPRSAGKVSALPGVPPSDPDAAARRQLSEAATQGWIRIEGDEVVTSVLWRKGQLSVNGRDMNALRDLARGLTGR